MALNSTTLKGKVADLYGLSGDTSAQSTAVSALDEAISEMNMELWDSLLSESTGQALTANQNYITIPSALYKEKNAFLVRTSDSQQLDPLKYLDWTTYTRLYGPDVPNTPGIPKVYSTFGQDGNLYLGPTPSSVAASDYTLTVQYYTRLRSATTAEADDQALDVPAEWEVPLLHKARQFFALMIAGPESKDIAVFQALYDSAITNLREADRRHPDEVTRFRMYDRYRGYRKNRAGGIYTKID